MENELTGMPWTEITKIIVTIITIVGSPVIAYILKSRDVDRRMSAFDRIDTLLKEENPNKLVISEYFRIATRLRMKYNDIKKIVDDENSIWMIDFLRKMPGYVIYEDGVFRYSKRFEGKWYLVWVQKVTKWFNTFGKLIAGVSYFLFSYWLIYLNTSSSEIPLLWNIALLLMIIFSAFGFILIGNMQENNEKVDGLILLHAEKKEDKNGNT